MTTKRDSIKLGEAKVVTEGIPKLIASSKTKSKYKPHIDQAMKLEKGKGYVTIPVKEGTDPDKAVTAIRLAIRREAPKDSGLKASRSDDGIVLYRE